MPTRTACVRALCVRASAALAALAATTTVAAADPALDPAAADAPPAAITATSIDTSRDPTATADQAFIDKALISTLFTVASARLATRDATLPANVRLAARDLVDDGTALDHRLRALALAQGFVVPTALTSHERTRIDRLAPLRGLAFLDAWVNLELTTHDRQISLFAGESRHSEDHDLGMLASHALPTLDADRAMLGRLPYGDDQDQWWQYWQRDDTADMAPTMPGHATVQ